MFLIALGLAQPLLMGVPSVAITTHEFVRFDNACFAFAVSYSAPRRNERPRAVVTEVIRFPARRTATCDRNEGEIRSQLGRVLKRRGSRHARTHYTAPVVYTYSRAGQAYRRRAQVIGRIERRWKVVGFRFEYLPRVVQKNPRKRWKNGRPGPARALPARALPNRALPARLQPRAPVRIVRRGDAGW